MLKYILIISFFATILFSNVEPYKIINSYNQNSKSDISICFRTNRYFENININKIKPYIKVAPLGRYRFTADYDVICIKGLKPDTKYTININKNIPLGKVTLDKSYSFNKITGDYKPSFLFKESGYILPIVGEKTIL